MSEITDYITLYHNTTNENAIKINKDGIRCGLRLNVYGEGSEAEASGIWCRSIRQYGNGGATITFRVRKDDPELTIQNDTDYILYRDVKTNEIIDIDLVISDIPCNKNRHDNMKTCVESDIEDAIKYWGKSKLLNVYTKYANHFVSPYDIEQFKHLIETGDKYCMGKINITEAKHVISSNYIKLEDVNCPIDNKYVLKGSQDGNFFNIAWDTDKSKLEKFKDEISAGKPNIKMWIEHKDIDTNSISKLEEASRNELLAIAKGETITRYNKAPGYKGFSIINIDTTNILRDNTLVVTCQVGKYHDSVQLEDILYWVQITSEKNQNNQVNTKSVAQALNNAIDGMDIKVDCECGDFIYRFSYQATVLGYKYGKPENRPADIRNPNNYGSICKHLISVLSNKKWLQQVTGTLMDFIEKNIDKVNEFLKVKPEDELTLPNTLARQNAKTGFYSKLFKDSDSNSETDTSDDRNEKPEEDNADTELK